MSDMNWEQTQQETANLRAKVARATKLNKWLALVTVLVLVAALATPIYRMANAASITSRCFAQEQAVETEAQTFRAKWLDFPNSVTELAAGKNLQCPGGGDYIWNPVTGMLTCSEHGHWGTAAN